MRYLLRKAEGFVWGVTCFWAKNKKYMPIKIPKINNLKSSSSDSQFCFLFFLKIFKIMIIIKRSRNDFKCDKLHLFWGFFKLPVLGLPNKLITIY